MLITKPKRGIRLNPTHPLSKGLVGCWLFNEGSGQKYYDLSLYGNHGTQSDKSKAPKWTSGKYGRGLKFDGTNDYLDCGNDASLNLNDTFTVMAWTKIDSFATGDGIVGKGALVGYFALGLHGAGGFKVRINDGTNNAETVPLGYSTGVWYNPVMVVNGRSATGLKAYINGALKKTISTSTVGDITCSTNMYIGFDDRSNLHFNGTMDNVRIYNRALRASEIKYSYRHPFAMFEFVDDIPDMFRYTTLKTTKELELWKDRIE